jgi:hypothetical protein
VDGLTPGTPYQVGTRTHEAGFSFGEKDHSTLQSSSTASNYPPFPHAPPPGTSSFFSERFTLRISISRARFFALPRRSAITASGSLFSEMARPLQAFLFPQMPSSLSRSTPDQLKMPFLPFLPANARIGRLTRLRAVVALITSSACVL